MPSFLVSLPPLMLDGMAPHDRMGTVMVISYWGAVKAPGVVARLARQAAGVT